MPLSPGTQLGPYEIVGAVGAGGMGEVYRARDSRLGRDVAIKVLPSDVATDPDRLRRFEQEARAAAALNHTGILGIFDFGQDPASGSYIVTELLDGQTLRELLAGQRLAISRVTDLAAQIADALAAAHSRGIIHRDIKPENIFVTAGARAKILDFGLAKTVGPDAVHPSGETTVAMPGTNPGAVLGTPGYMSPEQLRAQPVDHRTDIFAFGAVLYEMLSGRRAFGGHSAMDTFGAILRDPTAPIPSTADRPVPPALVRIVDRCLEKAPAARFQSTIDLAFALKSISQGEGDAISTGGAAAVSRLAPISRTRRETVAWMVTALATAGLATMGVLSGLRDSPTAPPEIRFTQASPDGARIGVGGGVAMAVSPDGTQIVFGTQSTPGLPPRLFLRKLGTTEPTALRAADISVNGSPFWSHDGRSIGFWGGGKLRRLDLATGVTQVIGDAPPIGGATWGPDGTIILGSQLGAGTGLFKIPASGGVVSALTTPDAGQGATVHVRPVFLPDGRHFLFLAVPGKICVGSLDSPTITPIVDADSQATYSQGHLLFVRQSTLLAQPFDADRLQTTGDPVAIIEDVQTNPRTWVAQFAASPSGVLVYQTGDQALRASLGLFDRKGNLISRVPESQATYSSVRLGAGGNQAIASAMKPGEPGPDLWSIDLDKGTRVRLTSDPGRDLAPVLSPDGTRVIWASDRAGVRDLYWKRVDGVGSDQLAIRSAQPKLPTQWTSQWIVFTTGVEEDQFASSLWVAPASDPGKAAEYGATGNRLGSGRLSPDGQWMAYVSSEAGGARVTYIQTFPDPKAGRWAVSGVEGGGPPHWRSDGREIVYRTRRHVMAVSVTPGPKGIQSGTPTVLFSPAGGLADAAPDHTRFLMFIPEPDLTRSVPLTVVVNWTSLARTR